MALDKDNYDMVMTRLKVADSDQLAQIITYAVELRKLEQKRLNRQRLTELRPEMRIMISERVKPKYLGRQFATVLEVRDTRVLVQLDRGAHWGKYRSGKILMPASACTILQNQPEAI